MIKLPSWHAALPPNTQTSMMVFLITFVGPNYTWCPLLKVVTPQLRWQSPLTGTQQEHIKRTSLVHIVVSPPQMTYEANKNTLPA